MNSSINETVAVPGYKTCTQCGVSKPGTAEFFFLTRKWLRSKCRECSAKYQNSYRRNDQEKWRLYNRQKTQEYRSNSLVYSRTLEINKEYGAKRRKNPKNRISDSIRSGMYHSLKSGKDHKSWTSLVGYSLGELVIHLERQFVGLMDWNNYGEWHIDHIVPLCSFSFDTYDHPDFKVAWSLSNLRPLWGIDNKRKNGRREHLL